MDYTLIHYNVMAWEGRAYDYGMDNLKSMGFPVDDLKFDPDLVIRGLVIDKEKGNLVKADRFGYIKRAMHGTQMLSTRAVSEIYGRELVDLRKEIRWEFLNTLFSVSEAVMFMQMVDKLDQGLVPAELGPLDYKGLYNAVSKALFRAHVEGQLKREIMAEPDRFVEPDPELPLALLDQKEAGKKLLLITNSDFHYTNKMMNHAFNRFLPNDVGWRDLFEMVIVSARKPEFFQLSHPLYEVVTDDGLMRPCFKVNSGGLYSGGSAQMVEKSLDIHGDEILYVGDHIYTDVSQSKVHLRWRTALICRELEDEFNALVKSHDQKEKLVTLIQQKEIVGDLFNQLRLALQRRSNSRPAQTLAATCMDDQELTESMQKLLIVMQRLDEKIGPMLEADGELFNKRWGWLSRAGLWDKSHLTRQIEKYADIYTSRVSNFLHYTPFMYFQSQEQTLAHDAHSYSGGKDIKVH
nr:5-nucleotidase [Zea mays]ACG30586.1 5-nucleotidase [Zea mays]